jgi:hypothetical protein
MSHLLFGAVKPRNCTAVVTGIDPLVASPEPATAKLWVVLDGTHSFFQNAHVHAVYATDVFFRCHRTLLCVEMGLPAGPHGSKGLNNPTNVHS